MKYAFIRRHAEQFKIARMCSVLGVSRSGYYEWRDRPESRRTAQNRLLLQQIRAIHVRYREAYGAFKTWRVLHDRGIGCGRHRVARLRRENGIEARRKRRFRVTVEHQNRLPPAPNLLNRCFNADRRDRVWVGDLTAIATRGGTLYLAVLLDLYSRRIVGWAMANRRTDELSLSALRMAIGQRCPVPGLLHHSDQGTQYGSSDYRAELDRCGMVASMSRKANAYDNAVVESFFSNLKNELVHHRSFESREQARAEIFDYIEVFYNRQRAHATLQFMSPVEYETINKCAELNRPENPG